MEHLADLKKIAENFIDSEHEIAENTIQINPEPGVPFVVTRPESPIPGKVPILVGEIVNNLRSALDYLVYELAILDSGFAQNGTQFPIEDEPTGFQGRRKSYLRGVSDPHAASVERLQPYNGVDWTRKLRAISNPDKHRHLTIQTHNSSVVATAGKDPAEVFGEPGIEPESVKGLFISLTIPDPTLLTPMHVQLHLAFFIAFDDGMPIIETLEQMQTEVANMLTNFKPEFKA